ncbi:beta-N-acetylhexosaminidase [Actinokineospora alba]|uniref:beta-N-acetylhexosaminidase n=1 Tax=Actinokineospora alba TaxID=504798 RepID=A0A1H0VJ38_9PSEU|nr:beta-N-acetylhexosaminidase [Actinokineospora alba]SDJ28436.1 beta-N-acetylhexosaminidase [Actinokineospora alba]SDP78527.1 beta-N-acetylhexosaminidase [Actinokineospora alba]
MRRILVAIALGGIVATVLPGPGVVPGTPVAQVSTATQFVPAGATPRPCLWRIAAMAPRARLAQLLIVGVDPTGPAQALAAVRDAQVGGIFLGGEATEMLVDGRLAEVTSAAVLPLTVAVDDEGGRVQRLDRLDGDLPSARDMARTMTEGQVRGLARDRAGRMRARGITLDFAPVVDISAAPAPTVIGDRSFSDDPATATRYAGAFADGLRDGGMLPVLKHFPGHGHGSGDSHKTAVRTPALADLGGDLHPYRELPKAGPVAVMFGHLDVPGLTDGVPASLHAAAYRLLRDDLHFGGLTVTDDLGAMRAVSDRYDLPDAVLLALQAGADIPFWSSGARLAEVLDRLEAALRDGELAEGRVTEALERVLAAKSAC